MYLSGRNTGEIHTCYSNLFIQNLHLFILTITVRFLWLPLVFTIAIYGTCNRSYDGNPRPPDCSCGCACRKRHNLIVNLYRFLIGSFFIDYRKRYFFIVDLCQFFLLFRYRIRRLFVLIISICLRCVLHVTRRPKRYFFIVNCNGSGRFSGVSGRVARPVCNIFSCSGVSVSCSHSFAGAVRDAGAGRSTCGLAG